MSAGSYRLQVCGTTTIVDLDGNALDGNGDGVGGDDFRIDFTVKTTDVLLDPNFDEPSLARWAAIGPPGAVLEHSTVDAAGAQTSGSLRLANLGAAGILAVGQCVPIDSEDRHQFGARLNQLSEWPDTPESSLAIEFFDQPGCEGNLLETVEEALRVGTSDGWEPYQILRRPPMGVRSALVSFESSASVGQTFDAWWDDTFASVTDRLFEDDFESGDLGSWGSVVGDP